MQRFFQEIDNLKIRPRKKLLKGGKGNFKGGGSGDSLDFYGHRKYIPGDDIRKIDWQAFLKTEEFYIREYTEERELQVNIILDKSASMDYGSPNKWEVAKFLAGGLSYLTLKQSDSLSFYSFNENLSTWQKNVRGRESLYYLIERLAETNPAGKTNFKEILKINNLSSGITIIITDLWEKDIFQVLDFLNAQGQEIILIHLLSPQELEPEFTDEWKMRDIETQVMHNVDVNNKVKEIYAQKLKKHIKSNKEKCLNREIQYLLSSTNEKPAKILFQALGGYY